MPDFLLDPARRRIVLSLARQASIQAVQPILEEAVHAGNVELIENMSRMLERTLKVSTSENDGVYKAGGKIEHLPSTNSQYSRAGKLCKLEDCPACFFNPVCQMEETEQQLAKSRAVLKDLKDSIARAAGAEALRNRSRVAF